MITKNFLKKAIVIIALAAVIAILIPSESPQESIEKEPVSKVPEIKITGGTYGFVSGISEKITVRETGDITFMATDSDGNIYQFNLKGKKCLFTVTNKSTKIETKKPGILIKKEKEPKILNAALAFRIDNATSITEIDLIPTREEIEVWWYKENPRETIKYEVYSRMDPLWIPVKLEVSASTLYREYEENCLAANKKYEGTIAVSGEITDFGTDIRGMPYIILAGNNHDFIPCYFLSDYGLINLKKGDLVTVIGEYGSVEPLGPYLDYCILIED